MPDVSPNTRSKNPLSVAESGCTGDENEACQGARKIDDFRTVIQVEMTKQAASKDSRLSQCEFIDSNELASKWTLPQSWIREQVRPRAAEPLPYFRLGKYVRFRWGRPELAGVLGRSCTGNCSDFAGIAFCSSWQRCLTLFPLSNPQGHTGFLTKSLTESARNLDSYCKRNDVCSSFRIRARC